MSQQTNTSRHRTKPVQSKVKHNYTSHSIKKHVKSKIAHNTSHDRKTRNRIKRKKKKRRRKIDQIKELKVKHITPHKKSFYIESFQTKG